MKKFTLILSLMVVMATTAVAQKIEDFFDATTTFSTYSGPITNIVDGNTSSIWWSAEAQQIDKTITVTLNQSHEVGIIKWHFCDGDRPAGAAVERRETADGEWIKIAEFVTSDLVNNVFECDVNGSNIKELRLRITTASDKWLKVAEVELYSPLTEREISVQALGGGTVSIEGSSETTITSNSKITIIATPNDGYYFSCWKVGDEVVGTDKTIVDMGRENIQYTAVFEENPEWINSMYRLRLKADNNYLTVIKKNVVDEEQSLQAVAKNDDNTDQIFIFEPDGYGCYYLKSFSGYYVNCGSWNAYAQNTEATTPLTVSEPDIDGYVSLYQTTSTHKHGYLNIQAQHANGLYCDATSTNEYTLWDLEEIVVDKSSLQNIIAEAEDLLNQVAEAEMVKSNTEIELSGKISSNAAQNNVDGNSGATDDGDGITGLIDTDPATYFHSRWGGVAVDEDHYLQIDLGSILNNFYFEYAVRKGPDADRTSPAPTRIEVRVSENGSDFGEPIVTLTKESNNLPAFSDLGETLWLSDCISATEPFRYVRLTVTNSAGPGNTTWEGHNFFAMGTLNLYPAELVIKDEYKSRVTVEQVATAVNALTEAKSVNNNNFVLSNQVNATAETLNTALEALRMAAVYFTLNVTGAGYSTLYLDYPAEIPTFAGEDAGAYIITGVKEGNWLELVKVEGVLPANQGIVVKADEGNYTFNYSIATTANVEGNLLRGTVVDEEIEKTETNSYYVLANKDGIGFYNPVLGDDTSKFKNSANKAYLVVSKDMTQSASLRFDFGGTTAIEEITEQRAESKVIFDLTGRRVNEITKAGVYIVNGKKVLVK